jgi:pimeloyl-[acyl-carrier protein] synthase
LRTRPLDLDSIAQAVLQPHLAAGRVDLVNEFGRPFATLAICRLLGLPGDEHERIARWGDAFLYLLTGVYSQQQREDLEAALREFREHCRGLVQLRRARPQGDLISAWLAAGDDDYRLGDDEVTDTAMLVVADGIDNVASLVGTSISILLAHPDELARVRDDADYARKAALECLRFETPGQYIARVASADVVIGGQAIRKDESVLLVLGASNRDGAVYADADRFCPAREQARHLSFGRGRHTCLGAQLVPLELEAAFRVLLPLLRNLRLAEPAGQWRIRPGHRWLDACPVEFDPA